MLVAPANAINATLYDKLNFNFIRDIAPVAGLIRVANVMEVNPALPAKTLPEFIAYAKANPGKVNFASAGTGSQQHVAGELLKMMAGIEMVHVPYRGGGPALADLMGGQVQLFFGTTASTIELIRSGKLRALAVTTAERSQALPDVPTVAEFVPGYEASSWYGIGAPRNTPADDHRAAQQGDQRRPRRSKDQGAARRHGRHRAHRLGRGVRKAPRRRDREVGQGGQGLRRKAGVMCSPGERSDTRDRLSRMSLTLMRATRAKPL